MRTLGTVLLLFCLPLAAVAGHALNDPAYTTSPGDLWVSGDFDCDGTGVFGGLLTLEAILVNTTMNVTGAVAFSDSAYFADNVTIADTLKVEGEFKGARLILPVGGNAVNQTGDIWLKGAGYSTHNTTKGYVMGRTGSIVGASNLYNIDSYTPTVTVETKVYVDAVETYTLSDTIDGTGIRAVYGTQARGTDTFVAGDILHIYMDVTGTVQYDAITGYIEVQFDD